MRMILVVVVAAAATAAATAATTVVDDSYILSHIHTQSHSTLTILLVWMHHLGTNVGTTIVLEAIVLHYNIVV